MKKLISIFTLLISLVLLPITSNADTDLFLNLGVGLGVPAPVFAAPAPVYYAAPPFAQASLVSEISPNTFLSFAIGVPAPVLVAPAPVIVSPLYYSYPSTVIIEPAPIIIDDGPHYYFPRFHPHGGPPGHFKHHKWYKHNHNIDHAYYKPLGDKTHLKGHKGFKARHTHGHKNKQK